MFFSKGLNYEKEIAAEIESLKKTCTEICSNKQRALSFIKKIHKKSKKNLDFDQQ